jgi:hypothetical protein
VNGFWSPSHGVRPRCDVDRTGTHPCGAAALSVPRATWRWFGLVSTVVHELGHAFSALMVGHRVPASLWSSTTPPDHLLRPERAPTVWSGFWGYRLGGVSGRAVVGLGLTGGAGAMSAGTLVLVDRPFHSERGGLLILLGTDSPPPSG